MYVKIDHRRYYINMLGQVDDRCVAVETPWARIFLWIIIADKVNLSFSIDNYRYDREKYGLAWYVNEDRFQHFGWGGIYQEPVPAFKDEYDWIEEKPLVKDKELRFKLLKLYLARTE